MGSRDKEAVSPVLANTMPTSVDFADFGDEGRFIRYALDNAVIVAMTDVRGTITFVNNKFCEISGYSREELIGSNHRMLRSGTHATNFFRAMYRQIARGKIWHGEICNRRKDGSIYWVDTTIVPHVNRLGKVDSYTSFRFDITTRREAEMRLHQAVYVDPLTGIANRRRFQEFLESALRGGDDNVPVHLALLDLDAFKEINDFFGHDKGDTLLQVISGRLNALSTTDIFVARLGGDEFGIVFLGKGLDEVWAYAQTVLDCVREPVPLGGSTVRRCSASIGIAAFPENGREPDQLFKAADMSLYRAKALGRDRVSLFVPQLREAAIRKTELRQAVELGLAENQFCLHYQPIVDTSWNPVSLEGLLRWNHPTRGLIAPGEFLLDIDEPGLQAAIGMLVVERAFKDVGNLIANALPIRRVAINLMNADFRSESFVERFFELSKRTGIPFNRFCIEVTEGVFLGRDFHNVEKLLLRLQEAGVEIALDDFGTGFASLAHLRQMPFDRIKIDRTFITNITTNISDFSIVRGVLDIAHSIGKTVTAEGVETQEQAELLSDLGCDLLQGWFFSKACDPERLPSALANLPHHRARLRKSGER